LLSACPISVISQSPSSIPLVWLTMFDGVSDHSTRGCLALDGTKSSSGKNGRFRNDSLSIRSWARSLDFFTRKFTHTPFRMPFGGSFSSRPPYMFETGQFRPGGMPTLHIGHSRSYPSVALPPRRRDERVQGIPTAFRTTTFP